MSESAASVGSASTAGHHLASSPQLQQLNDLLRTWESSHTQTDWDPAEMLASMSALVETETENYLKADPDPFDERHPTRVNPACALGLMFRVVCKRDAFMDKLVLDYTRENYWQRLAADSDSAVNGQLHDTANLNTQACRLLLGIMPGLETSVVFQDADSLLHRLFSWANCPEQEPLCSYATGLLAVAMQIQDITGTFREANLRMVPTAMARLKRLQEQYLGVVDDRVCFTSPSRSPHGVGIDAGENSNSSWAELAPQLISTYQLYPITAVTQQIMLLQYLTPLGEYQEWLGHVIEHRMLHVIFGYLESRRHHSPHYHPQQQQHQWHARLAFEALRYLSSLLCHKKFTLEFLGAGGVSALLSVPRPGVAATGVSMCLYYLAYSEDAMERVCQLPEAVVVRLVRYALWLLECSHESGRCHATMFFGLSFHFRAVLSQFERQDGMRKLLNVVSTLRLLTSSSGDALDESDDQFPARQIMRHVCVAIRCYLHAQLVTKAAQRSTDGLLTPRHHALSVTVTPDSVQQALDVLASAATTRVHWRPVTALLRLGGLRTIMQMMSVCQQLQFAGKFDTLVAALDALTTCCVLPAAQLQLCERCVSSSEGRSSTGIALVLSLTDPDVGDAHVQKAALRVIITCVWRPGGSPLLSCDGSGGGGGGVTSSTCRRDDVFHTVCNAVRNNNGIMALMMLLETKTPITDADAIRALACRALVGLARSDAAKQIMSKLPLFASGRLQMTVREPILQEMRAEHVQLQRDCCQLLSLVSGRSSRLRSADRGQDTTLDTIHRAHVVAQTRISYNERQLLHLIDLHLTGSGLTRTAAVLRSEAGLVAPGSDWPRSRSSASVTVSSPLITSGKTRSVGEMMASPARVSRARMACQQPGILAGCPPSSSVGEPGVSLHHIVSEYLMNQHSLCRAPMVTCPQFDLLTPHRCPEPPPRRLAPLNMAARMMAKRVSPPAGGLGGSGCDLRLVYSRYCPVRTLRDAESDTDCGFTCVTFCQRRRRVLVGDMEGSVRVFDRDSGQLDETFSSLHSSPLTHLQTSNDDTLLLTSSVRRRPLSALWSITGDISNRLQLPELEYVQFSSGGNGERLLGTERHHSPLNYTAHVYDGLTGRSILQMKPRVGNGYAANRAVFCPHNELVLNNGSLFDTRSGAELHKFDKFNNTISGVFHPTRPEVISNTEVWDLRTFHLLHTVPALHLCRLNAAMHEPVLFGVQMNASEVASAATLGASDHLPDEVNAFRVVDATNYSSIATVDVRRSVHALCVAADDLQLATVESPLLDGALELENDQVSTVRIYDVGRRRSVGFDGADDEDEHDDGMDDDAGEDDSDDDDEDDDDSDVMASNIADALFGVRRYRRGVGRDSETDSDSDSSGSTFSLVSTASASADDGRPTPVHDTANNSDNSWVTDEEDASSRG